MHNITSSTDPQRAAAPRLTPEQYLRFTCLVCETPAARLADGSVVELLANGEPNAEARHYCKESV